MGDPYNLNINDPYVAAMTGVPVRPGLAAAFSMPYADLSAHDAYGHGEHGGHGEHAEPSHRRKLFLLLSALAVVGGLVAVGKLHKEPPPDMTRASFLNPRTWGWARWNRAEPRYGTGSTSGVDPASPAHGTTPPHPHPPGRLARAGTWISDRWARVRP